MKLVTIVGTRPQFIKAAPVSRGINLYNQSICDSRFMIREILIHTGQHYDANMNEVFFCELELPQPHYNLGVGSGLHGEQTGKMLKRIEATLVKEQPDCVLVYGDTNSTLAGALASAKLHIPVTHVEAGLRSFNKKMPEELNRVLTDHLSSLLLCPTQTAVKNLEQEGITQGVHFVGDVMYEALLYCIQIAEKRSTILEKFQLYPKEYLLATVHRAENTDKPENLRNIIDAFMELARTGQTVVFPVHPRTRRRLDEFDGSGSTDLLVIDPVSYLDMLMLEKQAKAILTDSGGVQKEAYWFRVPCVTIRSETEWVEILMSGWNVLVEADKRKIVDTVNALSIAHHTPQDIYEDKEAAKKIIDLMVTSLH